MRKESKFEEQHVMKVTTSWTMNIHLSKVKFEWEWPHEEPPAGDPALWCAPVCLLRVTDLHEGRKSLGGGKKEVRPTHTLTTVSKITGTFLPGCPPAQLGANSQTNLWNTSTHLHFHIFSSTHRRNHTLVWSVCSRGFLWGWWFVHGIAPAKKTKQNMHVCMNGSKWKMCVCYVSMLVCSK